MNESEGINKNGIILPDTAEIIEPAVDKSILDIETDLSNLSYDDAKEYVVNIMAYKKELTKTISEIDSRIRYYYEKRPLAEKDPQFLQEVDAEIHKLEEKKKLLTEDELELELKVKELTDRLKAHSKISVTDLSPVLAQLEMEFDPIADKTDKLRMQDKLEQLKKRMQSSEEE